MVAHRLLGSRADGFALFVLDLWALQNESTSSLRSALLRASRRMAASSCRVATLRDAVLRTAPQDEVPNVWGGAHSSRDRDAGARAAMTLWITLAVNSIALGGLLFLLSAGFSLIFGLMRIPNLMHGSFFMLGAYLGVTLLSRDVNFWVAALLSGA